MLGPSDNIGNYNSRGRRTSVTDQNSKTTTYAYDDADRLTSVTDAANNVTTYTYDTEDNLTSITDAKSNATYFTYDAFGRVTNTNFPSSLSETYAYDANNKLNNLTEGMPPTEIQLSTVARLQRRPIAIFRVVPPHPLHRSLGPINVSFRKRSQLRREPKDNQFAILVPGGTPRNLVVNAAAVHVFILERSGIFGGQVRLSIWASSLTVMRRSKAANFVLVFPRESNTKDFGNEANVVGLQDEEASYNSACGGPTETKRQRRGWRRLSFRSRHSTGGNESDGNSSVTDICRRLVT